MTKTFGLVLAFGATLSFGCGGDGTEGPAGPSGTQGSQGPAGSAGPSGSDGAAGTAGSDGDAGLDGQLRVYGDGSAGDLTLESGSYALADIIPDGNTQFANVSIAAGANLTLPSGFVFRCTGSFTNEGSITVRSLGNGGGTIDYFSGNGEPGGAGVAATGGQPGQIGTGNYVYAGSGGRGLGASSRFLLTPTVNGGGGGGGALYAGGWSGGGSVWLMAAGAVVNKGSIAADQSTGYGGIGGGGAGGVIVVASRTSIENASGARLSARGGAGTSGSDIAAAGVLVAHTRMPGGGGGGGIIHLLAPSVSNLGDIDVDGGAAGAIATAGTDLKPTRAGGSGGGACGGSGGRGGYLLGGVIQVAVEGTAGELVVSKLDPTALL